MKVAIIHILLVQSSLALVQVWDNVVSSSSRTPLHQAATDAGLNHQVLDRQKQAKSMVGHALDSILTQLNDPIRYVEYWCRQEWRHIEAHADVDELLARTQPQDEFRFPQHGHVLYLQIGAQVQGPTCVFPQVSLGGDLLVEATDHQDLVVVPAVAGRLLRFPGTALHAVPRPHNLWTLPFVQGAAQYTPEYERSVILFNTWPDQPPLDVPLERAVGEAVLCLGQSEWQAQKIADGPSLTGTTRAKVWLLGDYKRRNHKFRTVNLNAPDDIDDILGEQHQVQRVLVSPQ